jgi:plastocyanin
LNPHILLSDQGFSVRMATNAFRLAVLLPLSMLFTRSALAGDIVGTVNVRLQPMGEQQAISPFARMRPMDMSHEEHTATDVLAVVYLGEDKQLPTGEPPRQHPVMDQRNITIIPHILPVVAGTTVDFPNSDALYHNLFSLSPARKFDLGRYPKGVSKQVTFDKPGEVHIYCDIHPSMSSVVLVLPNHFFTTVASDGQFRLSNIPAGNYVIHAWHEQLHDIEQSVMVPDSGIVLVKFEFGN